MSETLGPSEHVEGGLIRCDHCLAALRPVVGAMRPPMLMVSDRARCRYDTWMRR